MYYFIPDMKFESACVFVSTCKWKKLVNTQASFPCIFYTRCGTVRGVNATRLVELPRSFCTKDIGYSIWIIRMQNMSSVSKWTVVTSERNLPWKSAHAIQWLLESWEFVRVVGPYLSSVQSTWRCAKPHHFQCHSWDSHMFYVCCVTPTTYTVCMTTCTIIFQGSRALWRSWVQCTTHSSEKKPSDQLHSTLTRQTMSSLLYHGFATYDHQESVWWPFHKHHLTHSRLHI